MIMNLPLSDIVKKKTYIFRQQWTRAVVVKLFIEHVCTSGKEDIDIKRCMPLWTVSMIIIYPSQ